MASLANITEMVMPFLMPFRSSTERFVLKKTVRALLRKSNLKKLLNNRKDWQLYTVKNQWPLPG